MRTLYETECGFVELEKQFRASTWNVMAMFVKEDRRGEGVGTALMMEVCRDADSDGVELWLAPTPEKGRYEDLLRFYRRLGFDEPTCGYMIRHPKGS